MGLTLTRAINEAILIGDLTTVTVTRIGNGRVRLNVVAPPSVRVMRTELLERERFAEQCVEAGCIAQGEQVLDERESHESYLE